MGPCDLDAMLAKMPRATPEFARLPTRATTPP